MKKLDKLILTTFIGPFFLTFFVVVFIFLLQFLLRHFDDIVGKGLGAEIYFQLLMYFSINMTPVSFPLAMLLSALMTYGNLGEHSELTALKGAGISLNRTFVPMFFFSTLLFLLAYLSNNYLVPKANLKAYSLLYDIKQKTPALNIKAGVFYNDIPGYQIKVNQKFPDGETLKDIIIYNHTGRSGNNEVTLADSGRMYTIFGERYLVMELFNGNYYAEQETLSKEKSLVSTVQASPFSRSSFKHSKFIFNMESFDLKRTREELFASNRLMKNMAELKYDIDSMDKDIRYAKYEAFTNLKTKFDYHLEDLKIPDELNPINYGRSTKLDSTVQNLYKGRSGPRDIEQRFSRDVNVNREMLTADKADAESDDKKIIQLPSVNDGFMPRISLKELSPDSIRKIPFTQVAADSILNGDWDNKRMLSLAITNARFVKNHVMVTTSKVNVRTAELIRFKIQRYKIFAQAFSCLIMFLIGAPLGSIIKKGGLGFPVIVSIGFFIVFYVFMIMGEKWAKEELLTPLVGVWLPNIVLTPFGLFFLRQARVDARLFDADFYNVIIQNLKFPFLAKIKKPKINMLLNR